MRVLFVRRAYTTNGITVVADLDFVKKTVSLVEKDGSNKKWVFAQRTQEYMVGWVNILNAMQYAVDEARKEMEAITEKDQEEFVKMYAELDKALTPHNNYGAKGDK